MKCLSQMVVIKTATKASIGLLGAILLSGCVTGDAIRSSSAVYSAVEPNRVQICFEKPDRPYDVIGQVIASGAKASTSRANVEMLREQGAKLGADAILIQDNGVYESAYSGGKRAHALALKWKK